MPLARPQTSPWLLIAILSSLLTVSCREEMKTVTVAVDASEPDPDTAQVFITGNLPVLGNWIPDAVPMRRAGTSIWSFTFQCPPGLTVEFKITQGSWKRQAIYEPGVVRQNVSFLCTSDTMLTVRPISWNPSDFAGGGGVTGRVVHHGTMIGEGLNHARGVAVWLPPSYEAKPEQRYPVLYAHDGQNLFDPATSFLGYDWRVDEVADSLIRAGALSELVVVALSNTPDRRTEYSDTPLGRAYAEFVVRQVKPFIDSTYRTLAGPPHTAVMGSSMGGLISFLFAWWYPEVFGQAACLSSAFVYDEGRILRDVQAYDGPRKPLRFYLDCGGADLDERLAPGLWEMRSILMEQGYEEGKDLTIFYDAGAKHNEQAWAARVWRPLIFLFGNEPATQVLNH